MENWSAEDWIETARQEWFDEFQEITSKGENIDFRALAKRTTDFANEECEIMVDIDEVEEYLVNLYGIMVLNK